MISRRRFLRFSAAALPVLAIDSGKIWAASGLPLGVQLYTVRMLVKQDLPGTLKRIREIGYTEVETFRDSGDSSADKVRQIIDNAGLRAPSGHFDYAGLQHAWPDKLKYAKQIGMKWMVCPALPSAMWTMDGFRAAAKQFNEIGRQAQDAGMRFAFHNHDYEFRDYGGKTGYEILVEETDPARVFFELDCYWAAQAGQSPLAMLKKMGSRIRLLHLKDRKAGFPTSFNMDAASAHFAPVGEGAIAWRPILEKAKNIGIEHYFVEQDDTYGHPFECLQSSYQYLRTLV